MTERLLSAIRSDHKQQVQRARLGAIWDGMSDEGFDAIVVAGRGLLTQYGYLEYVLGYCPIVRLAYAVLFPGELPVFITSTASDAWYTRRATAVSKTIVAGQGDVISTQDSLPGAVADVLLEHRLGNGRIGIVGLKHIIPAGDFEELRVAMPDASLVDATALLGRIKAVKSADEQVEVLRSCEIADAGLDVFRERAAIGATGWQLWGDIQREVRRRGAREALIMISTDPYFNDPPRDEPLQAGQLACVYVEITGPNGFWVEKASLFQIGQISDSRRRIAELCLDSHAAAAARLQVGSTAADVARALEGKVADSAVEFGIWHGHGVGVDHDIPVITSTDPTPLAAGMVLALHPNFTDAEATVGASVADTFIVQPVGPARRGSAHDQELFHIEREA